MAKTRVSFFKTGAREALVVEIAEPFSMDGYDEWVTLKHADSGKMTIVRLAEIDYIEIEEVEDGVSK